MMYTAHFCGIFPTKHSTETMAVCSMLVGCLQENAFRPIEKWQHFQKRMTMMGGKVLDLTLDDEQLKQLKMLILESRHEGTRIFIKTRMRLVT